MTEMSPETTARADQYRKAATGDLATHIVAFSELIRTQGMDPTEAWVRCVRVLAEDRDPDAVARLAATAIVYLAEQAPHGLLADI